MKKFFIVFAIIVLTLFGYSWYRIKSGSREFRERSQNNSQNTQQPSPPSSEEKPPVVSESELAKLKASGRVSSDDKYYIKNATPFSKIVSLETGEEYSFKPGANYTQVTNLSWSGDGTIIAHLYRVPDPNYVGVDILNTATISDVLNQKFPNAQRVLSAAGKLDYVWLDANRILYYQLLNYDEVKKYYRNMNVTVYNTKSETFEYPWKTSSENIYSVEISPNKNKILYVQAVLDQSGVTVGREYVITNLSGEEIKRLTNYDSQWYK
ncbi:MAG TPA: hypothetical protein VD998_00275 [Verrucomicrobiae bacterium]|nr:hypothetical protein [Verrucomicrobiae bacterium]